MLPLVGYANRFSVAPGERIEFKVSSTAVEPFEARLVRVRCGDPNPAGPGIKEIPMAADFEGMYPSRVQPIALGSYARIENATPHCAFKSFTLLATIWPTLPHNDRQAILAKYDPESKSGFALVLDGVRGITALIGDGKASEISLSLGKEVITRSWYQVYASFDHNTATLSVGQRPFVRTIGIDDEGSANISVSGTPRLTTSGPLLVAALGTSNPTAHFNGKIEAPTVISRALAAHAALGPVQVAEQDIVLKLDFSLDISSMRVVDVGPHGLHGVLINLPARAMTGSNWNGEEMCWRYAPSQYGAIHFHDDDIYDCGWETDFFFDVPPETPSGVYAARLRCGGVEDMIPFFVRPSHSNAHSDICVIVPTYTYIVYGNNARNLTDDTYRQRAANWGARPWTPDDHGEYGYSTYNIHRDGSGICYASRLRPIITMRSGYLTFPEASAGSGLRHFAADTHLYDWLEAKGHRFDVVTDEDLHRDGVDLITGYKVVLTGSHPEYQTRQTLDALATYVSGGGWLMYLGGNGFYWRVAVHNDIEGAVEIRRGEGGIRAWAAEPGEYYNGFDGTYGGLWRRNSRPPQKLVGVGFTAQGTFVGSYYRRQPGADDPRVSWIFEGVEDEILGDFGLSGGGAAGFELDRVDYRLGTPLNTVVLASSEGHLEHFILVPEEMLTHLINWPREPIEKLLRADMVYFNTANNGAVFSVGSISFCGSLSHNNYDNNISRIVDNVIRRFKH